MNIRITSQPQTPKIIIKTRELHKKAIVFISDDRSRFAIAHFNDSQVTEVWGYIGNWEHVKMAQKTRYGVEFVNVRLTEDDKPRFKSWAGENLDDLGTFLSELIGSDYKLSMNLDLRNDCYIVAVTGTTENRVNKSLCMTSRASDLVEAILIALYKHFVLCESGSWGEPTSGVTDWG